MHARSAWVQILRRTTAAAVFAASFSSASAQDTSSRARPVQRLIIHYAEGEFALRSQQHLMKVLPPSDNLPGASGPNSTPGAWSGFWFELVAEDGTVLYRRLTENPIIRVVERSVTSLSPPSASSPCWCLGIRRTNTRCASCSTAARCGPAPMPNPPRSWGACWCPSPRRR
jgi:hypothetical protein